MQLLASEEYGLRCLLQVSRSASGAPVSISQIADAEGLSPEYTAKLMRELRLGGLVESVRGAEGGYRLPRAPGENNGLGRPRGARGALFSPPVLPKPRRPQRQGRRVGGLRVGAPPRAGRAAAPQK